MKAQDCHGKARFRLEGGAAKTRITKTRRGKLCARRRYDPARACFFLDGFGLICFLPGEARSGASEVTVGRGRTENRAAQVKRLDDSLGCELEERANQLGNLGIGNRSGAKRV